MKCQRINTGKIPQINLDNNPWRSSCADVVGAVEEANQPFRLLLPISFSPLKVYCIPEIGVLLANNGTIKDVFAIVERKIGCLGKRREIYFCDDSWRPFGPE